MLALSALSIANTGTPNGERVYQAEELTLIQRQDLNELEDQFGDVFSVEPGQPHILQHEIICQRPYQVFKAHRQAIGAEVARILEAGVIEKSTSPWSNNFITLLKSDGNLWLCNNFRKLNHVLAFNSYPMPQVDDLKCLGIAQFISTFKLTKGCWQVALTPIY